MNFKKNKNRKRKKNGEGNTFKFSHFRCLSVNLVSFFHSKCSGTSRFMTCFNSLMIDVITMYE